MIDPQEILKKIKNADEAEVYLVSSKSLTIDVRGGKVEAIKEVAETGCGIRVIKDKKLGFAFTSEFDDYVLEQTIEQALANARSAEADENNVLPDQPASQRTNQPTSDLYDETIDKTTAKEKVQLALQAEDSAYQTDRRVKKTEKVQYSDGSAEVRIVNSHGLDAGYRTNQCGAFAQVVAGHDGGMEGGFGISFAKKFTAFDPKAVGREAAERACQLLDARPIKSQKLPLLFDPVVGVEIIEALVTALSAEAVQKGRSMFADKLGQIVAALPVTLIDDGRLKDGLAAAPFDAEGVPTQETRLIENGTLLTFLHNTYTAKKAQVRSTGNGVRGTFKSIPTVGSTNLYLQPGKQNAAEILGSVKKGLFVTRVLGMHTVNPISGNFSVGAAGMMIEHGQKTHSVRGITIAGNLTEMLRAIEAVGSDLRFVGAAGAPTLLIHDMTISGV